MVGRDVLQVSQEGLQVLAAHCEAAAAGLVAATALPSVGGLPNQATAGAVGAAHAAVGRAVKVLARRGQTTAVKAAKAGAEFAGTDDAAARNLADIGSTAAAVTPLGV